MQFNFQLYVSYVVKNINDVLVQQEAEEGEKEDVYHQHPKLCKVQAGNNYFKVPAKKEI